MKKRCRKYRFFTMEKALIVRRRKKIHTLNAYYCQECKAWHLGNTTQPNRVQARIDYLLKNPPTLIKRKATNEKPISPPSDPQDCPA